jgi:RNA polymerase sigma-70 factor (ECF subfamily)
MEYERLVRQHKDAVYRQMIRACGNVDDAEDVLVESLLTAYRFQETLKDPSAFQAWLAMIARRVCTRIKRNEALHPIFALQDGFEPVDLAQDAEKQLEVAEMHRCVNDALASLPPKLKDVYERRELKQLSAEETALELGISVDATKSRLHRARQIVRNYFDQHACS